MKDLNFLEKIFCIKNQDDKKIIKIFNFVKIELDRKNLGKKYLSCPIENNKIVFNNFGGVGYGCNPKYIAKKILELNLPYKLVWLYDYEKGSFLGDMPSCIQLINSKSKDAIKELMTAKIIISNIRLCDYLDKGFIKRDEQKYIQTWHGSLGIKKIDGAVKSDIFANRHWCDVAKVDSKNIDYLISNSEFENDVFKSSFWYDGEIIKAGHPRNDIFFFSGEEKENIKSKVYDYLKIPKTKKILLYAPSFREDYSPEPYNIDVESVLAAMSDKFGGEWVFVSKMHQKMIWMLNESIHFPDTVIDASLYSDIQELLLASDALISDYSSLMFDFMLTQNPVFIFATDIEKYNTERGFYYPIETTPFPIATNNEEQIINIKNFDENIYKQNVELFLKDKGCIDDGNSSERIVRLIKELINEQ